MELNQKKQAILSELVNLSRNLGAEKDFVILGEGNTSARCDDETFFVKASGSRLGGINERGFVEVGFAAVLELLDKAQASDEEIAACLKASKVDQSHPAPPSVETLFHALLLSQPGVNFIGHIHPVTLNGLLCSVRSREIFSGRLLPEEIVVLGPEPGYVVYRDPGLPLAREIKKVIADYQAKWQTTPKCLLMENHGLVALGATPQEVEGICAMGEKGARIMLGAILAGGPRYLTAEQAERIHVRPDEEARRKRLREEKPGR
jgi:rhamnose utilization protein RhaD (predicted bifunctional aldolase and dehydrogenase)